jgi:hypothetical protein
MFGLGGPSKRGSELPPAVLDSKSHGSAAPRQKCLLIRAF